jgi:hypothetical protein
LCTCYSDSVIFIILSDILEILSTIFVILSDILEISLRHSYGLLSNFYRLQPPAKSLVLIDGVRVRQGKQAGGRGDRMVATGGALDWSGNDGRSTKSERSRAGVSR